MNFRLQTRNRDFMLCYLTECVHEHNQNGCKYETDFVLCYRTECVHGDNQNVTVICLFVFFKQLLLQLDNVKKILTCQLSVSPKCNILEVQTPEIMGLILPFRVSFSFKYYNYFAQVYLYTNVFEITNYISDVIIIM